VPVFFVGMPLMVSGEAPRLHHWADPDAVRTGIGPSVRSGSKSELRACLCVEMYA
jgi:hypothetical protein